MNELAGAGKSLKIDLAAPAAIPDAAFDRVAELLRTSRLFRYGEFGGGESEVSQLEREFAHFIGSKYAVAVNSCGSAMFVALKCVGIGFGDRVLVNAFTLAPVPGAVEHCGAQPVFVECTDGCTVDLDDLERKAATTGARAFLMSHMRGHIADMAAVMEICSRHDVRLIEDCAHTLGAGWGGRKSGRFGTVACFSLQAFKHVNAGEGGILISDDEDIAAKAILYSGSYMLYGQNGARPALEVFDRHKLNIPNFSLRMAELPAAVARTQLPLLSERAELWNRRYRLLDRLFSAIDGVDVPARSAKEQFVASSIQFSLSSVTAAQMLSVLELCKARGVDIKWFGRSEPMGFTSTWKHWEYVDDTQALPATATALRTLCDMRIPLALSEDDCRLIATILSDAIQQTVA